MERQIRSSYPLHIESLGPVEPYSIDVDLNKVDGIYLRYLLAAVSKKNQSITLAFGPSLKPQMVIVRTFAKQYFQDWGLDDFDKDDLNTLSVELEIDLSKTSLEEFARKVLLAAVDDPIVRVPAYRHAGSESA